MRRRRHTLQVSTFPFLAVLLCTMGSLILVLLVVDRKAKFAAQARVRDEAARQAGQAERVAAAARAEEERQWQVARAEQERKGQAARADWQRRRAELTARVSAEERALASQQQKLEAELAAAASRVRAGQEAAGQLRRQLQTERDRLAALEREVAAGQAEAKQAARKVRDADGARARLSADLVKLERTLKDLQETRRRDANTYSVVPYRGKRGESRRPLYIECAAAGLVFHPDRLALPSSADAEGVRAEVEKRIARQKLSLTAAGGSPPPRPYLMLLVRPDGVVRYYQLLAAVRGLELDFGYEFVDPDWVLDFPEESAPAHQPWMAVTSPAIQGLPSGPAATARAPRPAPTTRGGSPAGSGAGPLGEWGPGGSTAAPGSGGVGAAVPSAVSLLLPPAFAALTPTPGIGLPGGGSGPFGARGAAAPGPTLSAGPTPATPGGGSSPGVPAPVALGTPMPTGPTPAGVPLPSIGAPPSTVGQGRKDPGGGAPAGAGTSGLAAPSLLPTPGGGAAAGGPAGPGGTGQPAAPVARAEPGQPGAAAPRLAPPAAPGAPRPVVLKPAWLHGDREWTIYVECRHDGVVLYPTRRQFALESLSHSPNHNPLYQALRQLVARRQASVHPGEKPYRVRVRFLVWPGDGERTYHLAYPALASLPVPKAQQKLQPEDDVAAITAGN